MENVQLLNKTHHIAHDWGVADVQNFAPSNLTPLELLAKDISSSKVDYATCSLKGDKIPYNSLNNRKISEE